ncbi:hypothetical protein HK405_014337, partial [Cladochytrium tenue]
MRRNSISNESPRAASALGSHLQQRSPQRRFSERTPVRSLTTPSGPAASIIVASPAGWPDAPARSLSQASNHRRSYSQHGQHANRATSRSPAPNTFGYQGQATGRGGATTPTAQGHAMQGPLGAVGRSKTVGSYPRRKSVTGSYRPSDDAAKPSGLRVGVGAAAAARAAGPGHFDAAGDAPASPRLDWPSAPSPWGPYPSGGISQTWGPSP